jgi:hypothetical protein
MFCDLICFLSMYPEFLAMLFMLTSMLDLCSVYRDLFHTKFNIASVYILNATGSV